MKKQSILWLIVLLASIGFGMIILKRESPSATTPSTQTNTNISEQSSARDIALSCTTDNATTYHIHVQLTIRVNGLVQPLPPTVGIQRNCMNPLHTHDTSGIIHVESPVQRDFTLGDFFAVWEQPFDRTHLLSNTATENEPIRMTVNGVPSDQYERLVLLDDQEIVVEYETNE